MSYSDRKLSYDSTNEDKYSRSYEESFILSNGDDDRYIEVGNRTADAKGLSTNYHNEHTSPKRINGISLNLSFAAEAKEQKVPKADEPDIQEESVTVVFDLPDGSQGENDFKLGQTVEVLKSYVESEYGIPMMEQVLYLDDKVLQNPFSLLDYPEVKGKNINT